MHESMHRHMQPGSIDNSSTESRDGTILPEIRPAEARRQSYIEISEPAIMGKGMKSQVSNTED